MIISVTDSGTGIPRDLLDKIFEPFFTTKELNKGTGLGLSTVMAIVKSHGGFVNVYSELGKGTTFKVYLPAMESIFRSTGSETGRNQVSLPRGNGETVLVVDDEDLHPHRHQPDLTGLWLPGCDRNGWSGRPRHLRSTQE